MRHSSFALHLLPQQIQLLKSHARVLICSYSTPTTVPHGQRHEHIQLLKSHIALLIWSSSFWVLARPPSRILLVPHGWVHEQIQLLKSHVSLLIRSPFFMPTSWSTIAHSYSALWSAPRATSTPRITCDTPPLLPLFRELTVPLSLIPTAPPGRGHEQLQILKP
jgi:hypothetical protein